LKYSSYHLIVFSLIFFLVIQLIIPIQGYALENANLQDAGISGTQQEATKITLEQAIQIAKNNFEIPQEFTEFRSGFSNYNYRQAWSLHWETSGESSGSLTAQVDAVSGEIINMNLWKSSSKEQGYKLPDLSLEQARTIADNTVKRLAKSKYSNLKFLNQDNIIPINTYGTTTYNFLWQRMENGIPFQGNGVNVQINATNGQVTSYNLNWNNLILPSPDKIIDSQKASETFSESKMLELQYFLPPIFRPLATGNKEQVKLVYQLNKNGLIDAFSGKPLALNQNQWVSRADLELGGMGVAENSLDSKLKSLTPQEQKEIEQNTTLLTKEKALEVVKQWLEIPTNLTLRSMNLNTDGGLRDTKVWYFEWISQEQERAQSIDARVDAVSGELIGFNCYNPKRTLPSNNNQSSAITSQEAQKIAEDFLKRIQPSKFQQVRLKAEESSESPSESIPAATSASFNYERIVDGIVFTSNGLSVTVDLITKKITSYYLNWWNLDFPSVTQALSQAKAEDIFLKSRPLILKYVLIYNNGEPKEAKLVYQPSNESNKVSEIIDALTGNFLDWQGKPLSEQPGPYHFTDIIGEEAEKEITTLGQAGIFGEYGSIFRPKENITAVSSLRALLNIQNGAWNSSTLSDEEVLKKAKEQGWLKEEISPSQNISREMFSKIIIRYLGLEKIANLNNIYRPPFEDVDQLTPQTQGHISLATGLGILKSESNKFEPSKTITRAEVAYSIIQALGYGLRF
jgi:hypothetical protein